MSANGITLIKVGGSLLEDTALRADALRAVAGAWHDGTPIVVTHGGGKKIDAVTSKLGIRKRTFHGLRITDAATLEVVISVLAGVVNKSLVAELHALGVGAAGICGADGDTLSAELHPPVQSIDFGYVGKVSSTNSTLVETIAATGFLPVVASVASGPNGTLLNVNADSAAAALAIAMRAARLVFLTDVEGLRNADGRLVEILTTRQAEEMLASPVVTGGMKPKLQASIGAIEGGVGEVVIAGPGRHADALRGGKGGTHLVAA